MIRHDLNNILANNLANTNTAPISMQQIITMTARQYLASLPAKELQSSELYNLFLHEMEQALFEETLRFTGGNESKAARILGISRGTLRQRRELFGHYDIKEKEKEKD